MVWTIILAKNKDNHWYVNYIENKLLTQIERLDLLNDVEVAIVTNIEKLDEYLAQIDSDYISVIAEPVEFYDAYIESVYKRIKKTGTDAVGFKGIAIVKGQQQIFHQQVNLSQKGEIYLPLTQLNPIKKSVILQNHRTYFANEDLGEIILHIEHISDIALVKEYSPPTTPTIKTAVSFCIPAYQAVDFIEECLDSISRQTCEKEILVGIDGCKDTLNKVEQIAHKYPFLRIFWFPKNVGTYVIKNTLASYAVHPVLSFFDADDIMCRNYAEVGLRELPKKSMFRTKYYDFKDGEIYETNYHAHGIMLIHKEDFLALNGYWEERMASDLDFLNRAGLAGYKDIKYDGFLMKRRLHANNISFHKSTGLGSDRRKAVHKIIDERLEQKIITNQKLVTAHCEETRLNAITFCVPAYKATEYIEECLDSISKQKCTKEIIVGVDACKDTLDKLTKIAPRYNNLRIFWFPNNVGTSIVKNTIAQYARYPVLSFFDSDDIMKDDYSYHVLKNITTNNIVRFRYKGIGMKVVKHSLSVDCANGIMSIWKPNFFLLNGFWEHRITEDFDFIKRWQKMGVDTQLVVYGFLRRLHDNNISYDAVNGCFSDYGKELDKLANERAAKNKLINDTLVTADCVEITSERRTINNYFDKIYCVNLDKRPEKWEAVKKKFDKLGIRVTRFSGVDGQKIPDTEMKKYTISRGEVGCLLSHRAIIKEAKEKNYQRILIFEDDVMFVENFHTEFEKRVARLGDWKMLYLGGTQYNWSDIEFIHDFYYTNHTDGTFAYAVDQSLYDEILGAENTTKPVDYKLWETQKKHYKECYTCFPNLVIADVASSDIRGARNNNEQRVRCRWNLAKYE